MGNMHDRWNIATWHSVRAQGATLYRFLFCVDLCKAQKLGG